MENLSTEIELRELGINKFFIPLGHLSIFSLLKTNPNKYIDLQTEHKHAHFYMLNFTINLLLHISA